MDGHCDNHSGFEARIERAEKDIQTLFGMRNDDAAKKSNTNVSAWLFAGTALLSVIGLVIQFVKG